MKKRLLLVSMCIVMMLSGEIIAQIKINDVERIFSLISKKKIKAYLGNLASDRYEGRGTGQIGGEIAAKYIADKYKEFGLKKVNGLNGYFQEIPLVSVETKKESDFSIGEIKFKLLEDYVMNNELEEKGYEINADLVYVGYGIKAPEYNWDDYKDVDVKNKVLIMLVNEPKSDREYFFDGKALTYYGRWTYKYKKAAEKGALGAILIHTDEGAGYGWNVVRNSWGRKQFYPPSVKNDKRLHLAAWITFEKSVEVFKACNLDYREMIDKASRPDFVPEKLCVGVKAKLSSEVRRVKTANVICYIPADDEKYATQPVIITSHYDHLGKGKPVRGDAIYNGAVDNASGMSVLLELARIFGKGGIKFKRPVVFMATAAKEDGLRGSEFYVKNPLFPIEQTAANINIDSVWVWGPSDAITFLGVEKTNLGDVVSKVAEKMNLKLLPEAHPELGMFFRSDQFSFVRANVPSIYIKQNGYIIGKPQEWTENKLSEYSKTKYHSPFDEYDVSWDLEGIVQMVKIVAYTTSIIANMEGKALLLKRERAYSYNFE